MTWSKDVRDVRREGGFSWARPGHAFFGAVALDDDIRSVGCRAAKGTDVGDVTRVTPPGVEPTGEVHSSLIRCACGSSMSIPRVGALKGRKTSWEVDRRMRDVRWSRG